MLNFDGVYTHQFKTDDRISKEVHQVPKQLTWHPSTQKFYFVDIKACRIGSLDPRTGKEEFYPLPAGDVPSAISLNWDGSLEVARTKNLYEGAIYYFRPQNSPEQQWMKLLEEKMPHPGMRFNNGRTIVDHANQSRFYIGTCVNDGKALAGGVRPGRLHEMVFGDDNSFYLNKLTAAGEFVTVNSVAGFTNTRHSETFILASDSAAATEAAPTKPHIRLMQYQPGSNARWPGRVTTNRILREFEPHEGRPDGSETVGFAKYGDGRYALCASVAMIGTPAVAIIGISQDLGKVVGGHILPEGLIKPTIPMYVGAGNGVVQSVVTAFDDGFNGQILCGNVSSDNFSALPQAVGSYPSWEELLALDYYPENAAGVECEEFTTPGSRIAQVDMAEALKPIYRPPFTIGR